MSFDSSSDEEVARAVRRNTSKSDNTQQVIAQIHFPREQPEPEIVQHHPSSLGGDSDEESPKSAAVDPHKHQEQCSSLLAKPRSTGESMSFSATAQDGNGAMEEAIQIEKNDEGNARCDALSEKESNTLDQQGNEELATAKTSDSLENTKPSTSDHGNNKPQDDSKFSSEEREDHADAVEQIQRVSEMEDTEGQKSEKPSLSGQAANDGAELAENGAVKPLDNDEHSEGAEPSGSIKYLEKVKTNSAPTTEQLDGSTEKTEVRNPGLTMKEGSIVVKGFENGHHPESALSSGSLCPSAEAENNTGPKLDQSGGNTEKDEIERSGASMTLGNCVVQPLENGQCVEPTITHRALEETGGVLSGNETNPGVAQLSRFDKNENHVKPLVDQPIEGQVEGEQCTSTDPAPTVKQEFIEDDGELFLERDSISECSSPSKASESWNQSTPFENDTGDESYSGDSIHTSDSFNFIEDEGKAKASVHNGGSNKQQQREGSGIDASKIRSSPGLGFCTIVPVIEDEEIGSLGRTSCRTCPGRQSCLETKDKQKQDVRRQGANDDKQSTVLQRRPSNPVKIPAPQNRLLTKVRDTASGSAGSKWSECVSFVSAIGSIESFHTARSRVLKSDGGSSNDGNDHDSESNHSSDDKPHVLPISSSFVDVICAVNRVTGFACHLREILCPDETSQSGGHAATAFSTSEDEHLKNESLEVKRRLNHRLLQVLIIP